MVGASPGEQVIFEWNGRHLSGRVYEVNPNLRTVSIENDEGHLFINVMEEKVFPSNRTSFLWQAVRARMARMKERGAPL